MRALDRKLLRDLRLMWSQALTIALVVASGIGGFLTSLSAVDSLSIARDRFYAEGRFADAFASVRRAPLAVAESLRALPGVVDVQATLEEMVRVEIAGVSDPIVGQLIGLDPRDPQRMNRVSVSRGRFPENSVGRSSDGSIEVLVSEGFAQARHLGPGSHLDARINGRRRSLVVVGTALSPEFIFAGLWGMPDMQGFGIFWLDREVLASAYDMHGAFTRVAVKIAPGASEQQVVDALSRHLSPYGGRQAHGRDDQTSHAMLDNEIKEQRVLGTVLPAIFLAVAAFLLNVVISRVVSAQREQIAALKALGYTDLAIALHYLKLVLLIVTCGLCLGVVAGDRLGTALTGLYAELFHFPTFEHRIAPWLIAVSVGITVATAVAGTLSAILATVRLAPAEAMRPPSPRRYGLSWLDHIGLQRLGPVSRMILRTLARRPLRTGLSVAGIAAAVAIVILGNFFRDAIDVIVDSQFTLSLRGDMTLWTTEAMDDGVRLELARLPGVRAVESTRFVPVLFVHSHRRVRSLIRGYAPRPELYRVIDTDGREILLDGRGLILTDRLADKLGIRVGDRVQVEILEGRQRALDIVVGGIVSETMGLNAYMDRRELNRVLGEGDLSTGFVLSVEPGAERQVLDASKELPRIAGAWSKAVMLGNMQAISARNVRIMSTILTAFATVIAIGVVYNNARVALAERAWELASLRVLGFTRGEVSAMLLGELALLIALALPLGMAMGWSLTHGVTNLLSSDQFHFPVVIRARTYAWAALCVVLSGVASATVVRRRIDGLDMVSALKTRD